MTSNFQKNCVTFKNVTFRSQNCGKIGKMDEFIANIVKILSSTINVRIISFPSFAIESLLASVVCIVHCLLIFEVNTLVRRTNAKAAARLRLKHPVKESDSYSLHSILTLQATQVFHKKPEVFQRPQIYKPTNSKLQRRYNRENNSWLLSKGDSILRHTFSDRVDHLLSISPSEYIRRDKERKNREQGIQSCIQSLTTLLEKALNSDGGVTFQSMSKEDIKKSINALRENFESELNSNSLLADFPPPSLQSMIDYNAAKRALKSSVYPDQHIPSIYRCSNMSLSKSNHDTKVTRHQGGEDANQHSNEKIIAVKSSQSLSELFRKQSSESFGSDKRQSRGILVN
ncbi:hypothetical protein HUJ04_004964 [Dendroctonus ponderosae]|nr:hypothetical protein HUJ04_004964 [Dendroctonus ponderosae]